MDKKAEYVWFAIAFILAFLGIVFWRIWHNVTFSILLEGFALIALIISVFKATFWRKSISSRLVGAGIILAISAFTTDFILIDLFLATRSDSTPKYCIPIYEFFEKKSLILKSISTTAVVLGVIFITAGIYIEHNKNKYKYKKIDDVFKRIDINNLKGDVEELIVEVKTEDIDVTYKIIKKKPVAKKNISYLYDPKKM